MRLASLYSGGKDSTLSLYITEPMGHDVAYIVNIVSNSDDSMIFHVPNANMVPLLAGSMGKELITASTKGDEKDDMEALRTALKGLNIDGVVTGAVWSDYQWDRINAICEELGLVCLSPLWKKDQDIVMKELIDSGIKAIIVGVYADGLDDSWLGKDVGSSYSDLMSIRSKNKISVIGEGGEFETLTIDSPLQRSILKITEYEKQWNGHSGTLHVKNAVLTPKNKIRQFTNDDIDYMISRQINYFEEEYGFDKDAWKTYIADGVHELVNRFDPEKDVIFILESSGHVSGCIAVTHREDHTAQMRYLFVEPAIRGSGAGNELIGSAIDFCRERRYEHIFLWTFSELAAARHLYEKNGFKITDTHENKEWGEPILEERWDLHLKN
ncbi:MAG: diphthine--ammonia ligase [Methanomassiliicoccaceae archaeon]|jgi:ABC transporter with metal-binding/Fe-S-binding domain ATP-binding protein|nr:diphthine--ammonia ligase [Methanomassiliicoccaceae archaeon]